MKRSIILIVLLVPWWLSAARIVSLAPAVTEIVFALGKGEELVGNTQFCDYPPQAKSEKIIKVGAALDMNRELLIGLKPDVVILYPSNLQRLKFLENRVRLVVVDHSSLQGLFDSIPIVARELGVPQRGEKLLADIKGTLDRVGDKARGKKPLKTLFVAGRNKDKLRNMYIVGPRDFLNRLLEIAGGVNAYEGDIDYPNISVESVVAMNPDFIVELSVFYQGLDRGKVMDIWGRYPVIKAVKNGRIRIIEDNVWLRPGPRVGQIAEELYRMLHGEEGGDRPKSR